MVAGVGVAEYLRGVDVVGGEVGQGTTASVGVIDVHRPGLAGARLGWLWHQAWMEVFSSALITYSSSPSCSPCQVRAYRCSTQAAFSQKPGLVMKVPERCCQGLSASWASQRRTVDADMNGVMPRRAASRASSGHDQRESGTSLSAGSRQAGALSSAACSGANEAGGP